MHNYPLTAQSEAALKELERIKVLRSIEIVEREVRLEILQNTIYNTILLTVAGSEES